MKEFWNDIMNLLIHAPIRFSKYRDLAEKYNCNRFIARLKDIIVSFRDLEYLGLNPREYKKRKEMLIGEMRR